MIDQIGEFLRLYAWTAMPVLLSAIFAWRLMKNPAGLISIAPLCLIWIAGRAVVLAFGDSDAWAWDAAIDAFGALGFAALAVVRGPRLPLAIIAGSLAAEVAIHCIYGWHLISAGYDKPTARIHYWSTFAVALGQIIAAAKWGGARGGKRRGNEVFYRDHAGDLDRSGGLRMADRLLSERAGG